MPGIKLIYGDHLGPVIDRIKIRIRLNQGRVPRCYVHLGARSFVESIEWNSITISHSVLTILRLPSFGVVAVGAQGVVPSALQTLIFLQIAYTIIEIVFLKLEAFLIEFRLLWGLGLVMYQILVILVGILPGRRRFVALADFLEDSNLLHLILPRLHLFRSLARFIRSLFFVGLLQIFWRSWFDSWPRFLILALWRFFGKLFDELSRNHEGIAPVYSVELVGVVIQRLKCGNLEVR